MTLARALVGPNPTSAAGATGTGNSPPRLTRRAGSRLPFREDLLGSADRGAEVHRLPELVEDLLQRGERRQHVEVAHVAHVAEAEDPALHLPLPARDGDVVPGAVGPQHLLAVE